MTLKHSHQTAIADDPAYDVGSDEWNGDHVVSGTSLQVQYNNAGSLTGMDGTSWNNSTRALTFGNGSVVEVQGSGGFLTSTAQSPASEWINIWASNAQNLAFMEVSGLNFRWQISQLRTFYISTAQRDTVTVDGNQNVVISDGALATNSTAGFLYIPTCAGTPTGTPDSYTGRCAMVYDTTNNKLYVYNGAWKASGAFA